MPPREVSAIEPMNDTVFVNCTTNALQRPKRSERNRLKNWLEVEPESDEDEMLNPILKRANSTDGSPEAQISGEKSVKKMESDRMKASLRQKPQLNPTHSIVARLQRCDIIC